MKELEDYILRQLMWSSKAFGDGPRTEGICKHIESELGEIRANPKDINEWVDVIILALDGAWRAGHTPDRIVNALYEKQHINMNRKWPEPGSQDQPSYHVKEGT